MIPGGDEIGSPLDITGILASAINLVPASFSGPQRITVPVKAPLPQIPKAPVITAAQRRQIGETISGLPQPASQPGILQQLIEWYIAHQLDYSKFPIPADWQAWIAQFVRATLDASINAFEAWVSAHKPVDPPVPVGFVPTCSKCQLVAGGLPPGDYQEELI